MAATCPQERILVQNALRLYTRGNARFLSCLSTAELALYIDSSSFQMAMILCILALVFSSDKLTILRFIPAASL